MLNACDTAERTACGANHHGGQVSGIGHTLSRHAATQAGCLPALLAPPSHLKMPVRERLGVVARHATHMASRRDGGRAAGMALDIGPNSRRRYTAAAAQATARPAGGAAVTQLAPLGRVN